MSGDFESWTDSEFARIETGTNPRRQIVSIYELPLTVRRSTGLKKHLHAFGRRLIHRNRRHFLRVGISHSMRGISDCGGSGRNHRERS